MRTGIHFTVTSGDRQRLQAIVADPKSSQKHVWRARHPEEPATSTTRVPGRGFSHSTPIPPDRPLPEAMDAERHQVVHQVVAFGDAVEDAPDQGPLVRRPDAAAAELGERALSLGGHRARP